MRARSGVAVGAALLALAAGGLGACGSDESGDSAVTPAAATSEAMGTTETSAASGGAAMTATVGMEGVSFVPDAATVAAGGTVTFDNTSTISHNVTFDDAKSGTLEAGASYERAFEEPGTYAFLCTFHAGMKGTVIVE